jgi:hypothetical protein
VPLEPLENGAEPRREQIDVEPEAGGSIVFSFLAWRQKIDQECGQTVAAKLFRDKAVPGALTAAAAAVREEHESARRRRNKKVARKPPGAEWHVNRDARHS